MNLTPNPTLIVTEEAMKIRPVLQLWSTVVFVFAAFAAADAAALLQRTFVDSNGSDSAPCSLAQPCRSFSAAQVQTNAGGEIVVLDSAGTAAWWSRAWWE